VSRLSHLLSILPKKSNTLLITGAGISTSCGIPDYRSPTSTRLQSGPGQYHQPRDPSTFNPLAVSPSYTHQAITSLVRSGLIKTVLSQNVDNLHLKARLPSSRLIEVHGNICKEYCEGCGRLYYRNYCCRDRLRPKDSDHYNGRNCLCGGRLLDTLVFFG
jgi:NAD-dependent SIR2 family protein deacetylase